MAEASPCKTLHYYFRNSSRAGSSSSIREPLPRKSVHDSEKEHDHTDVHDDDSDVLITSVEGPSCSTTGKQLNIVTIVTTVTSLSWEIEKESGEAEENDSSNHCGETKRPMSTSKSITSIHQKRC